MNHFAYFSDNDEAREYDASGKNGWAKYVTREKNIGAGEKYLFESDEYSFFREQFIHFMTNLLYCILEYRCD